jgi:hypothetical protein
MPPTIKLDQAVGFNLWALKAVLNARGRGDRLGGFLPRPLGPVASKARSRQQLSQRNVKKHVKVENPDPVDLLKWKTL